MRWITIEAEVRYLPGKEETGSTVINDGCQALFWSEANPGPWDCIQYFPELLKAKSAPLGKRLRTRMELRRQDADDFPAIPITRGTAFEIRDARG